MTIDGQSSLESPLGDRIDVFKPMMGNIVAGFILSFFLIIAGVIAIGTSLRDAWVNDWNLRFKAREGSSWSILGLFSAIGLGLNIAGCTLASYSKGLISRRVELFQNGFRFCSRQAADDVLWTEVACIKETVRYQRPPVLKGLAKKVMSEPASESFTVVTTSGTEYLFNGNSIKALKRFGKLLRAEADRLSLEWERHEVYGQ